MNKRELSARYNAIREKGAATRLHHESMPPFCVMLNLDMKCLNKKDQNTVEMYFLLFYCLAEPVVYYLSHIRL